MRSNTLKYLHAEIAMCMFDGIAKQMEHLAANCGPDFQREINQIAKVSLRGRRKAFDVSEQYTRTAAENNRLMILREQITHNKGK